MKRLTHEDARSRYPGAIETWVILVLEQYQQDYADEREVLRHTVVWDDVGTLVLSWQSNGRQQPPTTRWNSKSLEWADEPDMINFLDDVHSLVIL